jgi:hypothetical protein
VLIEQHEEKERLHEAMRALPDINKEEIIEMERKNTIGQKRKSMDYSLQIATQEKYHS